MSGDLSCGGYIRYDFNLNLILHVHRSPSPSPSRVFYFATSCLLVTLYYLLSWHGKIFHLELNDMRGRNISALGRVSKLLLYAFSTFWASPLRLYASFLSTL